MSQKYWGPWDEATYNFMQHKYADRKGLFEAWQEKRKHAEKSEKLSDGKPNPRFPFLSLEAEVAQLHYEMSFFIDRQAMMGEQVQLYAELWKRVDILEGAYSHIKMIADLANTDKLVVERILRKLEPLLKEQADEGISGKPKG